MENNILFKTRFINSFRLKHRNFVSVEKQLSPTKMVILSNGAFYITVEDTTKSFVVELIKNESSCKQDYSYKKYLTTIRSILLNMYGEIEESTDCNLHKVAFAKRTRFY